MAAAPRSSSRRTRAVAAMALLACLCCAVDGAPVGSEQRVALSAARASQRRANTTAGNGRQQAIAVGIPLNTAYLAAHPEVAATVPLAAPDQAASNAAKYGPSNGRVTIPNPPSTGVVANARAASTPVVAIASTPDAIVRASGNKFVLNGATFRPSGTSWYDMLKIESHTEAQITNNLAAHYQNGVRLTRMWGHIDGYGTSETTQNPIQQPIGVFNETVLQRYDFVLNALATSGIRIILSMTNFWNNLGGIQWYVDNTVGTGQAPELFYTNVKARNAYKAWLTKITSRVNTINGRKYSQDPTIFAWELCNECHTNDNYEINQGLPAGQLVFNWQVEMSTYLKTTLGVQQMVTNGNEGYRALGAFDKIASIAYPYGNWINSGLKGEDFARNLQITTLDFATIHAYPSNFGMPNTSFDWINANYIGDRQLLAKAANKPLLLEEYGQPQNYLAPRDVMFSSMLAEAASANVAGTLVWEAWVQLGWSSVSYDFAYTDAGGPTVLKEYAYRLGTGPAVTPLANPALTPAPGSLPVSCSKALYRAVGGCKACVSSTKPFTKTYGKYSCVQPTTLSSSSTTCTNLVLPASIRKGTNPRTLATCIDTSGSTTGGSTVTVFLPLKSSVAPFLKGSSTYVKASLTLASTIPAKRASNGQVIYNNSVAVGTSGNKRLQVQFVDTAGVLKGYRGKSVQVNGVLTRGGTLLSQCFTSMLKVCS